MGSHISTAEPADSVSGAEALLAKHSEHKAEVDARQESMSQITKSGKKLIQQNHYATSEVRSRGVGTVIKGQECENLRRWLHKWGREGGRLGRFGLHSQEVL